MLRGYDASTANGQPLQAELQPTSAITLTLYWQSLRQTPTDWSIFAHVRNQAGETVAQKDVPAGNGTYPASLWDPGEMIADSLVISLPSDLPPGEYSIVAGLYNLADGNRIIVPDALNNEIELRRIVLSED